MSILKPLAIAVTGLTIGMGGTSAVFAKGHDQGVADGQPNRVNPGDWRGGIVAGVDLVGVGRDDEGKFLGVVDLNHDLTYGQDVVAEQRAEDIRRVHPIDRPGQNKPPR